MTLADHLMTARSLFCSRLHDLGIWIAGGMKSDPEAMECGVRRMWADLDDLDSMIASARSPAFHGSWDDSMLAANRIGDLSSALAIAALHDSADALARIGDQILADAPPLLVDVSAIQDALTRWRWAVALHAWDPAWADS